jgi:hypothetical protein
MATDRDENDIVRLVTAPNPPVAHIWQQALADAGIKSRIVGDYLDAGIGNLPGIKAEVWVHRDDVARAEEVLKKGQALPEDAEPSGGS